MTISSNSVNTGSNHISPVNPVNLCRGTDHKLSDELVSVRNNWQKLSNKLNLIGEAVRKETPHLSPLTTLVVALGGAIGVAAGGPLGFIIGTGISGTMTVIPNYCFISDRYDKLKKKQKENRALLAAQNASQVQASHGKKQ